MVPLLLGILAGTCLYAAIHHFQISLHLRSRSPHLLLIAGGLAFGAMCLLTVFSYRPMSVAFVQVQRKLSLALGLGGAIALYWFVGLRAGASRRLLGWITALLGVAIVVDLVLPSGLNMAHLTGFEEIRLPWGDIYQRPVAVRWPVGSWVLRAAVFLPVPFLFYTIWLLWRRGDRWEATVLWLMMLAPLVPAFVDIFLVRPAWVAFPFLEVGLAATMVALSVLTSLDVAQAAALRGDLERSEAGFRRLVETAPEAIGVFDTARRRFVGVNQRAEELLGRSVAEIESMDLEALLEAVTPDPGAAAASGREVVARALAGETPVAELKVVRSDGTQVSCELRLSVMGSPGEELVRVSLLDVSERKAAEVEREEMESRLRWTEKLETLGTLAGGIAHDLNNMLTPIVGYGELALDELASHPARAYVAEMQASAERASRLTQHILTFSRQSEARPDAVEIQPVVEQALRFLRATLPARIELEVSLQAPESVVNGDTAHIHQILMSLGTNAAQAMGGEGRLRVALRSDVDSVTLEVADTGRGMDRDTLSRAFDPFFTTKASGRASGLGLSVVHGIVTSWGGSIDVDSAPGAGSVFRIRLPRVGGEGAA